MFRSVLEPIADLADWINTLLLTFDFLPPGTSYVLAAAITLLLCGGLAVVVVVVVEYAAGFQDSRASAEVATFDIVLRLSLYSGLKGIMDGLLIVVLSLLVIVVRLCEIVLASAAVFLSSPIIVMVSAGLGYMAFRWYFFPSEAPQQRQQ